MKIRRTDCHLVPADVPEEMEIERRHNRAIRATMILGLIMAVAWATMVIYFSAKNQPAFEDAYSGLLRASAGAMIIGGLTWCIRAAYFFIRGIEGMGLGDVKMMSVVGAFMGWSRRVWRSAPRFDHRRDRWSDLDVSQQERIQDAAAFRSLPRRRITDCDVDLNALISLSRNQTSRLGVFKSVGDLQGLIYIKRDIKK